MVGDAMLLLLTSAHLRKHSIAVPVQEQKQELDKAVKAGQTKVPKE